jgi:hypothetical protein
MNLDKKRSVLIAAFALWLLLIGGGMTILWGYERTPGAASAAPDRWPAGSRIRPAADRPTLVMLVHPRCPCTRASIGELARLMTQAQGRVTAYVLFVKLPDFPDGWEQTDLWAGAAAIPGVTVVRDDEGAEAGRFRATTSGQTVLYDASGKLLFSGGITSARGLVGDNAGRAAAVSLLTAGQAGQKETPVYGCPLFAEGSACLWGERGEHEKDKH